MTKPIPDKAEVPLEYPDKVSIGTFEQRHISMLTLMIDGADAMQAKQNSGLSSLDGGDSPRKGGQHGLERHLFCGCAASFHLWRYRARRLRSPTAGVVSPPPIAPGDP
jgi:hypothetical protein